MIVDTSALVAIVRKEPEASRCFETLRSAGIPRISAASLFETWLIIGNAQEPDERPQLERLLRLLQPRIEPVTEVHALLAREAHRQFGRGNHPAKLNFGDCFSYALARATGEPLLFVGNDFAQTDITPA